MGCDRLRDFLGSLALIAALGPASATAQAPAVRVPPPDGTWTADAVVESPRAISDPSLGAAQGVAVRDGKVYVYGDVYLASPRVGVIREYDLDLKPTGRAVWLRKDGKPLLIHPTGLTWDDRLGTFLGDTVQKKARIYRLDWDRAWLDGNLDHAVLDVIEDDSAINGCRPVLLLVDGRTLLGTADYGDFRPELRLYDPDALLKAGRSSAPGVSVARVLIGPWNQNLHWDEKTGELTCVQNVIEGRGWRLDVLDLRKAMGDGRADGPGVRIRSRTFEPHNELEGIWPLDRDRSLIVTSSPKENVMVGVIRETSPHPSPPATIPVQRP